MEREEDSVQVNQVCSYLDQLEESKGGETGQEVLCKVHAIVDQSGSQEYVFSIWKIDDGPERQERLLWSKKTFEEEEHINQEIGQRVCCYVFWELVDRVCFCQFVILSEAFAVYSLRTLVLGESAT